jgi:hypothetical protein
LPGGASVPASRASLFNPNSEIGTADFADVKQVSFRALASDFEAVFVSKLLFIRAIRASRGFNSGFRVKTAREDARPTVVAENARRFSLENLSGWH